MVFFTCSACGESLKKVQVDKHVQICRGCEVLSCIDCGADFWGESYRSHVRCISEDQKYGGKGFEAKANKGDVKQQQWINKIQVALSKPGLSSGLQNVLQQVATYDNVPRKKSKFQNWMKNSLKITNCSLHEQVWEILSAEEQSPAEAEVKDKDEVKTKVKVTENGCEKKPKVVDSSSAENEKKKLNKRERKEARRQKNRGKPGPDPDQDQDQDLKPEPDQELELSGKQRKRKRREENGCEKKRMKKSKEAEPEEEEAELEEPEEAEPKPKGKFNWKGNIKAVLRSAPDQELSVKKLRKKVLGAYFSFTAAAENQKQHKSEEEILALFNRKIHKNPKFRVLKDRVRLIP